MINYCQNSEVLSAELCLLGEYFGSVFSVGELRFYSPYSERIAGRYGNAFI